MKQRRIARADVTMAVALLPLDVQQELGFLISECHPQVLRLSIKEARQKVYLNNVSAEQAQYVANCLDMAPFMFHALVCLTGSTDAAMKAVDAAILSIPSSDDQAHGATGQACAARVAPCATPDGNHGENTK